MAIKETFAGARSTMNIFPAISTSQAVGPGVPRVESLQAWIDDFVKRQASMAEYRKLMHTLREVEGEGETVASTGPKEAPPKERRAKKYLVDIKTGLISVDEEDGEYDFKEAQLVSQSARAGESEYEKTIALIKAARGEAAGEGPVHKKGFYVEDNGEIVPDSENGDLSLSEARAISASRRALAIREEAPITKEGLELLKRDMKDEMATRLEQEVGKRLALGGGSGRGDSESPFTFNEKGDISIRAGARVSLTEMLLYQSMRGQGQGQLYKDAAGTAMPLPAWLELERFKREERRKDEMGSAVTGLFEMGRKELPNLIAGIQNMSTSKKAEHALEKGGWGKGKSATKTADKGAEVITTECAGCHQPVSYVHPPCIVTCPRCHGVNMFGSPEEQQLLTEQLAASMRPKGNDGDQSTEEPVA